MQTEAKIPWHLRADAEQHMMMVQSTIETPYHEEATMAAMRRALGDVAQARVVVKAASPFELLEGNNAFYELMGYSATGSTLKILHGQTTRVDALESTIQSAVKEGGVHECQLRLYTACAQSLLLRVQVSQIQTLPEDARMQEVKMVLLSFSTATHICRAIDVKTDVSAGARVVVQNTAPFHIQSVSPDWAQMYGMSESTLLGRALRVIEGPGTDSRVVRKLMLSVARGVEGRASFVTYDVNGKRLWTHLSTAPLLAANGTIDSFVAQSVSFPALELKEAMAAIEGHLLVVAIEGHKRITHATRDLCKLLSGGDLQTAGLACESVLESTANSEVMRRLVAEVVHGDTPHATPYWMNLQAAQGKMDARVTVLPVVNAEGHVTHLLLNLEPGEFFAKSEADNLREHVKRLEIELAEARAQTDAANLMAKTAVAETEAMRQQFNNMLAIVTSGPPAEDSGESWSEDDMMDDEWETPEQGLGGHHVIMGSNDEHASWTSITNQTSGDGASRKRMHLDMIEVPLIQSFSKKFEQEQVTTGFALCDSAGAILWSNALFSQVTGYTAEQVVGCQWHTFLCGAQTDGVEVSRVRSMMHMRLPHSSHMQLYHEDGEVVWMQVRIESSMMEDRHGVLPVVLLCLQDVSEVMDGTYAQNLACSHSAQSAHRVYHVSQVQEEAIAHGLASIRFVSAPAGAKQQLEHPQDTCASGNILSPVHDYPQQESSVYEAQVHAMHHLSLASQNKAS